MFNFYRESVPLSRGRCGIRRLTRPSPHNLMRRLTHLHKAAEMTSNDSRALFQAGIDALQRGRPHEAKDAFTKIIAGGRQDADAWLGLAFAHRALNDPVATLAAVDRALSLEPHNWRALIFKGDHFAGLNDARAASAFYMAAVKAAPPPEQLSANLRSELARAQAACEQFARQYESYLVEKLKARGFDADRSSRRFASSMDLLLGRKKLFLQEPRYYYFPELPQIQFYDRAQFPWAAAVEAATGEIRAELTEILKTGNAFVPYVEGDPNRPAGDYRGMLNNPDWSAFFLWKNGAAVPENATRCPNTMRALEQVPLARTVNRSPSILFSALRPGTRIPPHTGFVNTRLICHLPLIIPEKCGFRVGNDVRGWNEGELLVFDDTIEHEAWNESNALRVVLIFDVWRPELSDEERALVAALFESIDAFGGQPAWDG